VEAGNFYENATSQIGKSPIVCLNLFGGKGAPYFRRETHGYIRGYIYLYDYRLFLFSVFVERFEDLVSFVCPGECFEKFPEF
jgi:hypothetical protein